MFKKKNWVTPAMSIVITFLGVFAAKAEQPQCYTLASLQGSWAFIGTYGANVATTLGQRYIDANGVMTGVFTLNAPTAGDSMGARTISNGTLTGTYAINCDGRGTITRTTTSSLGIVATTVDDFIITSAVVKNGQLIATALSDAQQAPSFLVPGGIFITRVHTRLPDRPGPTQP